VLSSGGPKWSGHSQIFFFGPLAMPLVRLRHTNRAFLPSIPSPPLCFYSSFFTKKKNPFSLEFSQSYQGARLNFKKTRTSILIVYYQVSSNSIIVPTKFCITKQYNLFIRYSYICTCSMDLYDKIILLLFFAVEHFTVMDV
jgi:hypothetical protein